MASFSYQYNRHLLCLGRPFRRDEVVDAVCELLSAEAVREKLIAVARVVVIGLLWTEDLIGSVFERVVAC